MTRNTSDTQNVRRRGTWLLPVFLAICVTFSGQLIPVHAQEQAENEEGLQRNLRVFHNQFYELRQNPPSGYDPGKPIAQQIGSASDYAQLMYRTRLALERTKLQLANKIAQRSATEGRAPFDYAWQTRDAQQREAITGQLATSIANGEGNEARQKALRELAFQRIQSDVRRTASNIYNGEDPDDTGRVQTLAQNVSQGADTIYVPNSFEDESVRLPDGKRGQLSKRSSAYADAKAFVEKQARDGDRSEINRLIQNGRFPQFEAVSNSERQYLMNQVLAEKLRRDAPRSNEYDPLAFLAGTPDDVTAARNIERQIASDPSLLRWKYTRSTKDEASPLTYAGLARALDAQAEQLDQAQSARFKGAYVETGIAGLDRMQANTRTGIATHFQNATGGLEDQRAQWDGYRANVAGASQAITAAGRLMGQGKGPNDLSAEHRTLLAKAGMIEGTGNDARFSMPDRRTLSRQYSVNSIDLPETPIFDVINPENAIKTLVATAVPTATAGLVANSGYLGSTLLLSESSAAAASLFANTAAGIGVDATFEALEKGKVNMPALLAGSLVQSPVMGAVGDGVAATVRGSGEYLALFKNHEARKSALGLISETLGLGSETAAEEFIRARAEGRGVSYEQMLAGMAQGTMSRMVSRGYENGAESLAKLRENGVSGTAIKAYSDLRAIVDSSPEASRFDAERRAALSQQNALAEQRLTAALGSDAFVAGRALSERAKQRMAAKIESGDAALRSILSPQELTQLRDGGLSKEAKDRIARRIVQAAQSGEAGLNAQNLNAVASSDNYGALKGVFEHMEEELGPRGKQLVSAIERQNYGSNRYNDAGNPDAVTAEAVQNDRYVTKLIDGVNDGTLEFSDLKSQLPRKPELMPFIEEFAVRRKADFEALVKPAREAAVREIQYEYERDRKKILGSDDTPNQDQQSQLDRLDRWKRNELAKVAEEHIAPGSRNPTSDIDRSVKSTYVRKHLKRLHGEGPTDGKSPAMTSARSHDVNEYINVLPRAAELVGNADTLSKLEANGVFEGLSHSEATEAIAMSGAMRHLTKRQRQRYKSNLLNSAPDQASREVLQKQFSAAEKSMRETDVKLDSIKAEIVESRREKGQEAYAPEDLELAARDRLYGERTEAIARKDFELDEINRSVALEQDRIMKDDPSWTRRVDEVSRLEKQRDGIINRALDEGKLPSGEELDRVDKRLKTLRADRAAAVRDNPQLTDAPQIKALADQRNKTLAEIQRDWGQAMQPAIETYTSAGTLDAIVNRVQLAEKSVADIIADPSQLGIKLSDTQIKNGLNDQLMMMSHHINDYTEGHEGPSDAASALGKYAERTAMLLRLGDADPKDPRFQELVQLSGDIFKNRKDPQKLEKVLEKYGGSDKAVKKLTSLVEDLVPGAKGVFTRPVFDETYLAGAKERQRLSRLTNRRDWTREEARTAATKGPFEAQEEQETLISEAREKLEQNEQQYAEALKFRPYPPGEKDRVKELFDDRNAIEQKLKIASRLVGKNGEFDERGRWQGCTLPECQKLLEELDGVDQQLKALERPSQEPTEDDKWEDYRYNNLKASLIDEINQRQKLKANRLEAAKSRQLPDTARMLSEADADAARLWTLEPPVTLTSPAAGAKRVDATMQGASAMILIKSGG
jgi:hypothetical protein